MQDAQRNVYRWLVVVYLTILAMVIIGGITRLTGSGLSMVEWRPLMGALPPLTEGEWQAVFERYQQSPQYQQVNQWMGLADFKRIFFWEYFHRLMGRLVGVVFLLPWLYFVLRGRLRGRWARRTFVAFVLGGLQGLLGWFMVKSGLVDVPAVSHFRLAAHLSLAFLVGLYVAWLAWDLRHGRAEPPHAGVRRAAWALLALVAVQVVWGAFMAGTRAGYIYQTFPTMNGEWVPGAAFVMDAWWLDLVENPVTIHFVHRTLGWVALAAGLGFTAYALPRAQTPRQRVAALLPAALVVLQFVLGAATVLMVVAVPVAVAHQAMALLLLTGTLFAAHAFLPRGTPG